MKPYKTQKEKKEITRKIIQYEIDYYNALNTKPAFDKFINEFIEAVDAEKEIDKFPLINPIYKKVFDFRDIPDYETDVWESTWVVEEFWSNCTCYVTNKKQEELEYAKCKFELLIFDFIDSCDEDSLFHKKFHNNLRLNRIAIVTPASAIFMMLSHRRCRLNEFAELYPELLK